MSIWSVSSRMAPSAALAPNPRSCASRPHRCRPPSPSAQQAPPRRPPRHLRKLAHDRGKISQEGPDTRQGASGRDGRLAPDGDSHPKRKIGMAMMALFGLVAYIKTLLGGSEVAAQSAPDTPLGADDAAAPICETDNSSADNSGRMSYGNAALFQASARDDENGATLTSPQSSPSSVLSPASSGLQPERFDASGFQPAPLNFQPSAFAAATGPDLGEGDPVGAVTPLPGGG